jgi:hypothetical protein
MGEMNRERTRKVVKNILGARKPVSVLTIARDCHEGNNFVGNTVIPNMRCIVNTGREKERGTLNGARLYYPDRGWINPPPDWDPEPSCCLTCDFAHDVCKPEWRKNPAGAVEIIDEVSVGVLYDGE